MESINKAAVHHVPWNKGKLVGQKAPLKQREIWAIRIRLQLEQDARELALFNLAIDSKLRSCDLVRLRVCDICRSGRVASRAIIMQRKTQRPVQFEITESTRESLSNWMREAARGPDDYLFSSRLHDSAHLSTRQYARIVHRWVKAIGLNPAAYGTHTMRRTKAALIYRRTKKSAGRAAAARAQQAREHCQVPQHRRRRRTRDRGTDGGVADADRRPRRAVAVAKRPK